MGCRLWGLTESDTTEVTAAAAAALVRAWALGCLDFNSCSSWARSLWRKGLVARLRAGSSQTRDRTGVLCIARWILNHCTTRETPILKFLCVFYTVGLTQ